MVSFILAIAFSSGSPYNWTMSCARWHESRLEIMADKHIDYKSKLDLIRYFKTKVREKYDGVFI